MDIKKKIEVFVTHPKIEKQIADELKALLDSIKRRYPNWEIEIRISDTALDDITLEGILVRARMKEI